MFRVINDKGFQIDFPNGWTVSVSFGNGNYCENRHCGESAIARMNHDHGCVFSRNAEVAVFKTNDDDGCAEAPAGWVRPDEVAKIILEVSLRPIATEGKK